MGQEWLGQASVLLFSTTTPKPSPGPVCGLCALGFKSLGFKSTRGQTLLLLGTSSQVLWGKGMCFEESGTLSKSICAKSWASSATPTLFLCVMEVGLEPPEGLLV